MFKEKNDTALLPVLQFQSISGHYKNFSRINPIDFEYLSELIGLKVQNKDTNFLFSVFLARYQFAGANLSVQDRLAITLRYLATGDSFTSLQYLCRISKQVSGSVTDMRERTH